MCIEGRGRLPLLVMCVLMAGCGRGSVTASPAAASDTTGMEAAQAVAPSDGQSLWSNLGEGEWIDLSHTFDAKTVYWPTATTGFVLTRLHYGPTEGGWFYASNSLAAPEHGGTHLDAPIHFAEGQSTTERVGLERLIAPAVVIDISADAQRNPDATLLVEHIDRFEKEHGTIDAGTIVLVRTGWSNRWPDRKAYLGADTPGRADNLHFPGISEPAAKRLVERRIAAVGIDTASLDPGVSRDFMAHRVLMAADIPGFENVAALDRLPAVGALVIALPMKIGGGSGGPLRIVAWSPRAR